MSPLTKATTTADMYDHSLKFGRYPHLPPEIQRPCSTAFWPPEHIALLEHYREWLESGGASRHTIRLIYIVTAGHVLGLNLKPQAEINLETDFQKAMDFVKAKQLSAEWTDINRVGLEKFRRFLMNERGLVECKQTDYDPHPHTANLPEWLVQELLRYQHIKQRNWRDARIGQNIRRFWGQHLSVWRFLVEQCSVLKISDIKRQMLYTYAEICLQKGRTVRGVNGDLRSFHGFLSFLQEQEFVIPQALLTFPCLKEPDSLPKFLSDDQVRLLKNDFDSRVLSAKDAKERRDALLDQVAFYLLWQGGLRIGELEELRLEDLDLNARRLMVRKGKGMKDRSVYLTDSTIRVVSAYLTVRGMGPTDHVILYRNQPLCKDLVPARIRAAGMRVGVHVYPHRLRHTCATQLLNAGCRITSIQKFLGHQRIASTLIYARVHDQTVADDYYMAMSSVEQRLEIISVPVAVPLPAVPLEREQILGIASQLKATFMDLETRLSLADKLIHLVSDVSLSRNFFSGIPPPQ